MNVLKPTSELEQKVQRIEALMRELEICIDYSYGMVVVFKNRDYPIVDTENKNVCVSFPRITEGQRLQVKE